MTSSSQGDDVITPQHVRVVVRRKIGHVRCPRSISCVYDFLLSLRVNSTLQFEEQIVADDKHENRQKKIRSKLAASASTPHVRQRSSAAVSPYFGAVMIADVQVAGASCAHQLFLFSALKQCGQRISSNPAGPATAPEQSRRERRDGTGREGYWCGDGGR